MTQPSTEPAAAEPRVPTAVDALADRFWEGFLERNPLWATVFGDERYDDRLDDPSEAGRALELGVLDRWSETWRPWSIRTCQRRTGSRSTSCGSSHTCAGSITPTGCGRWTASTR